MSSVWGYGVLRRMHGARTRSLPPFAPPILVLAVLRVRVQGFFVPHPLHHPTPPPPRLHPPVCALRVRRVCPSCVLLALSPQH